MGPSLFDLWSFIRVRCVVHSGATRQPTCRKVSFAFHMYSALLWWAVIYRNLEKRETFRWILVLTIRTIDERLLSLVRKTRSWKVTERLWKLTTSTRRSKSTMELRNDSERRFSNSIKETCKIYRTNSTLRQNYPLKCQRRLSTTSKVKHSVVNEPAYWIKTGSCWINSD